MRAYFFVVLMIVAPAVWAADARKDAYLDAVVPAPDAKAMEGRVDPALRKAIADAIAAEMPRQSLPQYTPAFSTASSDIMTAAFIDAKVPDCLHSEGLKRQPTFFLTGFLALPFIPIAMLRGKCN
jgi:hypothetical protein